MIDGVRRRRAGFRTPEDAAEWLESLRQHKQSLFRVDGLLTLGQALEAKRRHLLDTRRSPETVRFYEEQFRVLARFFDLRAPLLNLRRKDVEEFVRRRSSETIAVAADGEVIRPSPRTIASNVATLRAIVNLAKREGVFVGVNPCEAVEMPRVRSQRFDALSESEFRGVLQAARRLDDAGKPRWPSAMWDADLFEFLAVSGLRRRGLARLRMDDCDPFRGFVTVFEKDGPRIVPLSAPAKACLSRLMASAAEAEFLIPRATEDKRASAISKSVSRLKEQLGLRLRGAAHVARHTFGTAVANIPGASTWDVQNALGDKTLAAAARYVHATGERRREIVEILGSRLSQADAESSGPLRSAGVE